MAKSVSYFCFPVRRRSMPRRGWQSLDVPSGWVQVLRGPRPPLVKWLAREGFRAPSGRWRQPKEKSSTSASSGQPCSRSGLRRRSVRGEEIRCWGRRTHTHQPVVEALRVARAKTTVLPLQERIKSCTTFIERARQRVARAKAVIEQKEIHVKEVSEWREPSADIVVRRGSFRRTSRSRRVEGGKRLVHHPRSQLRSQERTRVLGQCHSREGRVSSLSGHSTACFRVTGRSHGRNNQIEESDAKRRVVQGASNASALPSK